MIKKYFLLSILLCAVYACESETTLENFDFDSWVNDPNGCKGQRLLQQSIIKDNLESFKGLNQNEIKELLGKPDKNELYKRSQKFFIYYIGPAKACDSQEVGESHYLSLRFNAMGLAKEVLIYEE